MGKVFKVAVALCVGCTAGGSVVPSYDGGNPSIGTDGGSPSVGTDGGSPADAGPSDGGCGYGTTPCDAGSPHDGGTPDAGTPPDGGPTSSFGGPGPWPMGNVTYGAADGIEETPVVGISTDETQNLWVATNAALYLMRPGETKFHRYDASAGLHLPGNLDAQCYDSSGTLKPCPYGSAFPPGISEIVGGGPHEVFVGYYGFHNWNDPNDGTEQDPYRHSGKLDRVRLQADGSLEVVRFDMVSSNTVEYWHNRTVLRMIYDHFIHPHELYVGTDHGVDKISPDKWHAPVGWFLLDSNNGSWMSDHLHPRACYHAVCVDDSNQRLGDWRALGIDSHGDLWVGGRYAAGKIKYVADNTVWWQTPRPADKLPAFDPAFGDPYYPGCGGMRPIFCPPQEGDYVNLSAVTVARDGKVWWSSGILFNDPADVNYGIASLDGHQFAYFDPVRDVGLGESNVRDLVALPDGRLVVAGPNTGLVFWNPNTGARVALRAGQGIPDDHVLRLELDLMVNPPALHVATWGGAASLRVLP